MTHSLRLAIFAVLAVFLFFLIPFVARAEAPARPDIVEIIEISGEINSGTAEVVAKQVAEINENKRVKAVLLTVNSPGGGAVASAVVYEELSKLNVPVVGWCDYMCASGGIYALMAPTVKFIGVRSETISGSVGVIMQLSRYNRLLDWARIDNETFKSGALKDAGNPTREAQPDERAYLQGIVSDLAERFYGVVAKSRKITNWPELKTARIFIGDQAVKIGLVDAIMTRDQAIKKAKELSGSKLIFTRDELKKMSKDAEGSANFTAPPVIQPSMFGDLPWIVETLKEIRAGESIRFEYRLPYRF